MAQQRLLIGHVKGDRGDAGKDGIDAKVTSATGTVAPGHLDEPTVSIEFGGEPGAQTATFAFAGLQGEAGAPGKDGAAATIGTITAEVDGGTGVPEVSVTTEGGYDKDLKFSFRNLKGEDGRPGAAGANGRDAGISAVDVTVEPGHSESPAATAQVSGEPGAQSIALAFTGLQGADGATGPAGAAGPAGPAGAAAGFGTITVTVDRSSEGEPSCEASWSGDDASKDLTLAFRNLKGDKGDAGSDYEPQGTQSQVLLGDGTAKDISTLITENAEAIREALGLATTEHMGLVPQLPEAEE